MKKGCKKFFSQLLTVFLILFCSGIIFSSIIYLKSPYADEIQAGLNFRMGMIFLFLYTIYIISAWQICKKASDKILRILEIAAFAWLTAALSLIAIFMQLIPIVDLSHIYDQVTEMIANRSIFFSDDYYFGFYTNNIPLAILIYWIFALGHSLGIENFRLIGGLFNVICIVIAVYFIYKLAFDLYGKRHAAFTLLILISNPMLYAYGSYYYTDMVSLPFLSAGVYYLMSPRFSMTERRIHHQWIFGAILIAIAAKLRITSIFIIPALAAALVFHKKWKQLVLSILNIFIGFLIVQILYLSIYHLQVPFETRDSAVVFTHFLMMGSQGSGIYDEADVEFTRSLPTHKEKIENTLRIFRERIQKNGLYGNLHLILQKEFQVWGIGSHSYREYTEFVTQKNPIYLVLRGDKSGYFLNYCYAYNIMLMILIILSLISDFRSHDLLSDTLKWYFFGAILFYMIWESHPRHAVCFLFILVLLAGKILPFKEILPLTTVNKTDKL